MTPARRRPRPPGGRHRASQKARSSGRVRSVGIRVGQLYASGLIISKLSDQCHTPTLCVISKAAFATDG